MRVVNRTDYPTPFLRRLVGWVCRQIGHPVRCVRQAEYAFTLRPAGCYGGRAWGGWQRGRFLVRIHKAGPAPWYPIQAQYPDRVNAPEYTLADRLETVVMVTAHELVHLHQFRVNKSRGEASTDRSALNVLELFRADRDALVAAWSAPVKERPAPPPRSSVMERHQAKAAEDLTRWQRRLKVAQGKVRKYRDRVRYYERRQAARKG